MFLKILHFVPCAAFVYAPPGQSMNQFKLYFLQISHIMPSIDAYEIFSQYHIYFLTGSYFTQSLKMTLLSLSLNLEAQYCTRSWTQSGDTYNQRNSWSGLCRMKVINVFNNLHFEILHLTWNLPNVMKSANVSMKSGRFHIWNLKSGGFHNGICRISCPWNLLNFKGMKSRF